jgi:8-oxo-dGTP diphosphatase
MISSHYNGMTMPRERFKFSAAVFAVLRQADSVLSLRRSGTGWLDGYWSLPAGAHDGNCSFLDTAIRELREETSLHAQTDRCSVIHVQQVFLPDGGEFLAVYCSVEGYEGSPRITEPQKHDGLEWRQLLDDPEAVVPYVRLALLEIAKGSIFSTFEMRE